MALYIDDEQITAIQLLDKLKIPKEKYERLFKKPSFKLKSGISKKKRTITSPIYSQNIFGFKASFWFRDPSDGLEKRLRYAKSRSSKQEGGVRTYEYDPPYINVEGEVASFREPDLAVYMFLYRANPDSPFHVKGAEGYTFIDKLAETIKGVENMSGIQKALTHATNSDIEDLVILAKGLGLQVGDDYDAADLRLRMQTFAMGAETNPKYVSAMTDEIVKIEGLIMNLVDKNVFKMASRGSYRQWEWASGKNEGMSIGNHIANPNDDPIKFLKNTIKDNLGEYIHDLRNTTVDVKSNRKALEFLAEEKPKVPEHLANYNQTEKLDTTSDLDQEGLPTDFHAGKAFVESKGYKKIPGLVKQLVDGVNEGKVHNGNINEFLTKLYE